MRPNGPAIICTRLGIDVDDVVIRAGHESIVKLERACHPDLAYFVVAAAKTNEWDIEQIKKYCADFYTALDIVKPVLLGKTSTNYNRRWLEQPVPARARQTKGDDQKRAFKKFDQLGIVG